MRQSLTIYKDYAEVYVENAEALLWRMPRHGLISHSVPEVGGFLVESTVS